MKNLRFLLADQFQAESLAEDLRLQLEINRFEDVKVVPVKDRNEIIVQVPEANGTLEETVDSFMKNYRTGEILE
ncbi:hypothetical protein ACFOU2_08540 [Bacillus songklensis]|uniref:Uncharacterized protein n=1 Tax=Bacillus songklensis TaxID=1069116 RepID=A0ABV8B1J7_9BACI